MHTPLSPIERRLLVKLLHLAADEFSNHGCNDFALPNDEESLELLRQIERWNVQNSDEPVEDVPVPPDGRPFYSSNWLVMKYLAWRVGEAETVMSRLRNQRYFVADGTGWSVMCTGLAEAREWARREGTKTRIHEVTGTDGKGHEILGREFPLENVSQLAAQDVLDDLTKRMVALEERAESAEARLTEIFNGFWPKTP